MKKIKPIETEYNGYKFRSRLEARWAVFFDAIGLKYEYEVEGFEMDGNRYLPDFYIPSVNRWFEIKAKPLSVSELKKCESFCENKDNGDIKYSILIGSPEIVDINGVGGIKEYVWEWPSEKFPSFVLFDTPKELCEREYMSRFIPGIYVINDVTIEKLLDACKVSKQARFEYGEVPIIKIKIDKN